MENKGIKEIITKDEQRLNFTQILLDCSTRNIWRTEWRICVLILGLKRASHIIVLAKPLPSRRSRKYQKSVIELYIHISFWTDFVIFRQLVL